VAAGGRHEDIRPVSPTTGCACAQDELEPVLLANAQGYGVGDVTFDHELTKFEPSAAEVTATIRKNSTGQEMTVQGCYLVAADGADSSVRQALQVAAPGPGILNRQIGIYVEAPLGHLVADRPAVLYFIENAAISGLFAAVDNADRWVFYTARPPDWDQAAGGLPPGRCAELVRLAAGLPDLAVRVLAVLPWAMAAQTAERFRVGRVFLAGDAAHLIPPVGGYGMNTGIQDAHNLAWKLAGVLAGWAGPSLLDTYEAERQPVLARLLPQITTPVTIINGRHDRVVPLPNAEFLDQRLPTSRLVIIDAGHFAWEEAKYASIILDSITGNWP
jgi:putative polyketide hydroxylase